MAETTTSLRHLLLLRILSARRHGASLRELADETQVGVRTIQRDLDLFREMGFPLTETKGDHGRKSWKLAEDSRVPLVQFTLEEIAALYLGRQYLEPLAGTFFHQGARQAFQKIRATLGETALRHLEKLAASLYLRSHGWTDYGPQGALIDQLQIAVEEHRLTAIEYRSLRTTEPVTHYNICPYAIVLHKNALYLIGESQNHGGEMRTFKVDRISAAEVLKLQFTRRPEFDVEQHLEHSFGIFPGSGPPRKIVIRFDAAAGRILEEKQFHASQQLTTKKGTVLAEFQLSNFEELLSWVHSFGPLAEILEPLELRQQMAERALATARKYSDSPKDVEKNRRESKSSSGVTAVDRPRR